MSTFSSSNITDGNLVLKERTHRIKIKFRQLANKNVHQLEHLIEKFSLID